MKDEEGLEYLTITKDKIFYILIEGDYCFIEINYNPKSINEFINAVI